MSKRPGEMMSEGSFRLRLQEKYGLDRKDPRFEAARAMKTHKATMKALLKIQQDETRNKDMARRDKDADLASIERLIAYYEEQGNDAAAVDARRIRADIMADRDIIGGNPGNIPLHESLGSIADWVEYESKVVAAAADNLDDDDQAKAAVEQAEAMTEASAALTEASKAAAETAAEVFVETGVPSTEQDAEVVSGNPSANQVVMTSHQSDGKTTYDVDLISPDGKLLDTKGTFTDIAEASKAVEFLNRVEGHVVDGNPVLDGGSYYILGSSPYWTPRGPFKDEDEAKAYWNEWDMESLKDKYGLTIDTGEGVSDVIDGNPIEDIEAAIEGNPIEDIEEVISDTKPDIAPESTHFYTKPWRSKNG